MFRTDKVIFLFLIFLPPLLIFSGCVRKNAALDEKQQAQTLPGLPKLTVAVSILPQQWFVSGIGAGLVQAMVLAGPGQNVHNYEPTPKQINTLVSTRVWILSGAEFEISLLPKIKKLFPELPVVDGTEGVVFRNLEEYGHKHKHGETGFPHDIDRHTWLGREPAKILAAHIRDILSGLDPENSGFYSENYAVLVKEIDNEFDNLRNELAPLKGKNIFVYHPSFGYFLDEFGIRQRAVETGGKSPGPRDLNRLIAQAKQEQAAVIFVQAQFPANAAKTVADAVGARLIGFDPLDPDWLANIRRMGQALKAAIPDMHDQLR